MKIAISGKGGVGKTTLAAILGYLYSKEKKKVLLVDADTSGNLASALDYLKSAIIPVSQMKELIQERTGTKLNTFGGIFKLNPKVDDIPEKFSVDLAGIKLLVIGGIKRGGGGCACPENVFIKNLISHIILEKDQVVIMDMEAGVEHLGRATAKATDAMIIVTEPGTRSVDTAYEIYRLAKDIGIKNIFAVGNKIKNTQDSDFIKDKIANIIPILGFIFYNEELIKADMQRVPVYKNKQVVSEVYNIKRIMEEIIFSVI